MESPSIARASVALARSRRLQLAVGATTLIWLLVTLHVPGVNGPSYWTWPWRDLSGWRVYGLMLVGLAPVLLAQQLFARQRISLVAALLLLGVGFLSLEQVAMGVQSVPFELARAAKIVASADATSYFTDAARLIDHPRLLAEYPTLMPTLHLHSMTKPPGPLLYYQLWIALFGATRAAAMMAGLLIGLLAALAIPATYLLARNAGADRRQAFAGASLMALAPGLILFYPQFDQWYACIACCLIACWMRALDRNRLRWAAAYGLTLALACFLAYNLATLGVLLAGYALLFAGRDWGRAKQVARHAVVGLSVFAGCYLLLYFVSGFDPIATFRGALANQQVLLQRVSRPYPATVAFDLLDFALGVGWLPIGLGLRALWQRATLPPATQRMVALGWVQVAVAAITGLLPGETARVWIFMMPLVGAAAGLELGRWTRAEQSVLVTLLWLLLCALLQNMVFVVA